MKKNWNNLIGMTVEEAIAEYKNRGWGVVYYPENEERCGLLRNEKGYYSGECFECEIEEGVVECCGWINWE